MDLTPRGWGNAGWNNPAVAHVTPTMNRLVAEGINISHHYVFKYCSPTRTAIQSGRAPYHVNVINCPPTYYNPAQPTSGYVNIIHHEHAVHCCCSSKAVALRAVRREWRAI